MADLDAMFHAPVRLKLAAMLAPVDAAEFSRIRDALEVSDSVLSKHVSALVGAGYASNRKARLEGWRITWIGLTPKGREALATHVRALRALIEPIDALAPDVVLRSSTASDGSPAA